ncbi:MAG: alcohol dehydrogenase catalytic domain-containing protein [Candidatus Caenarcaniphilales bacterium]|nr:alcohol dehydrogenase catalytic domain-containing protein [Candidatus Caenarcaniphilales bacterium]
MKVLEFNPEKKDSAFLNLTEAEAPKVSKDSCLVKVTGCGVCGSDLLKLERSLVKPGAILGHEMVGKIAEISDELSARYKLKVGDRIVSSHHVPCLECDFCKNKQESLCTEFKVSNFKPGAFCEYLELSERHLKYTVKKIADHISDQEASFTEPLACCIKAIKRSRILEYKGEVNSLIFGLGSIGQLIGRAIDFYRKEKSLNINNYGADLLKDKREIALANGFDECYEKLDPNTKKMNFIFLAAGANPCVDLAIEHINIGGTILVFSSVADISKAFTNNDIYYKELSVLGSYSPNLEDLDEAYKLIEEGKVKVSDLISHTASIENLGETIIKTREENGMKAYLDLT